MPAAEARAAAAAASFLTRVPVGRIVALSGIDVARGGLWFPAVGAGIGAAVGGVAAGLDGPLGPLLAAAVAVAFGTVLTGALHLDGLADSADALGARSADRALEIMRDHRIGAYGAAALALDLLVRTAALASLTAHVALVVAAAATARAVPVALAAVLPYARSGPGTGASLGEAARWRAAGAVVLGAAIAVALGGALLVAVSAGAGVLVYLASRRLGGVTGDTLGASVEVVEVAALVTAVALL